MQKLWSNPVSIWEIIWKGTVVQTDCAGGVLSTFALSSGTHTQDRVGHLLLVHLRQNWCAPHVQFINHYWTALILVLKTPKHLSVWGYIATTMLMFYMYQEIKVTLDIKRLIMTNNITFFLGIYVAVITLSLTCFSPHFFTEKSIILTA